MPSIVSRCLSCVVPVLAALLLVLGDSQPAAADVQCFQRLRVCYFQASLKADIWEMWAAGLDCELELVDCVRRAIIGR